MFKYIIALLLCFGMFTSCKSTKEKPENIIVSSHVIKEVVHDTVFVVEADTSKYYASLSVDSSGQINIKNIIDQTPGDHLTAPKVRIKNNKLEVDCYAEAYSLYKQWVEKHQFDEKVITKIITQKIEKPLTGWQWTQIWLGRIAGIIVIIGLIGNYYKPFKKK